MFFDYDFPLVSNGVMVFPDAPSAAVPAQASDITDTLVVRGSSTGGDLSVGGGVGP